MRYILLVLLVLTSCSKNKIDPNLKVLNQVSQPLTHFDPQMTTGLASLIQLGKVYESLVETHPFDGPYKILPSLSSGMPKLSKDKKTYTFKLRTDVQYHDCKCFEGKTRFLKAEDFVTTFKRIADPKLSSPHYGYWKKQIAGLEEWYEANKEKDQTDYSMPMTGLKALDESTLQITARQPDLYFLNNLTSPNTAPIPMEAVKFFKNDLSNVVVGTGPFVLESYVRKSRIEYSKNKNYRKKMFPMSSREEFKDYVKEYAGKQVPFLDKIVVKVMSENQTQWLSFMKGQLDYLEVPKDNFAQAITPQQKASKEMMDKGIELGITPSNTNVYYFGFNNKDKYLSNVHLRRAIAYAYNQYEYNELFFNKTAEVANSVLPPGVPGNIPPLKSPYLGPKLNEAREELKKAGFPNGEGLPELTLTVRNSTLARQVGEHLVKEMKKVGIPVKVEMVAWGKLLEKAQKGDFQMFYLAWFVGLPTGFQFFDLLYGPNWPGSYNRMGHTNPEFDKLFDGAMASIDPIVHEANFAKMNMIALENVPLFPLVHARDFFLKQGWLKNYIPSEASGGLEQYFDIDIAVKKELLKRF